MYIDTVGVLLDSYIVDAKVSFFGLMCVFSVALPQYRCR